MVSATCIEWLRHLLALETGVTPLSGGGRIVTFRNVHDDHVAFEALLEREATLRAAIDRLQTENAVRATGVDR